MIGMWENFVDGIFHLHNLVESYHGEPPNMENLNRVRDEII